MLCLRLRLLRDSPQLQKIINDDFVDLKEEIPGLITGLSCRLNQTIGFLHLNKKFSGYFMKLWNHPEYLNNSELMPDSIALISNKDEQIYWMNEEILNRCFLKKYFFILF